MAKYCVEDTTFSNIADAIRTKTGNTAELTPLEMPAAILGITGGGSGSGTDFGALNYAEITAEYYNSSSNQYPIPDLSPYISDFSQVAAMYFTNYVDRATYVYLKGVGASEGYPYKLACIRPYTSTNYAAYYNKAEDDSKFYFLDAEDVSDIKEYYWNAATMTTPQLEENPFGYFASNASCRVSFALLISSSAA